MTRKIDPKILDHLTIRRALHNAAGACEIFFSEFAATWEDSRTNRKVHFTGTIDSQISLRTARIQGSVEAYDLKDVFTPSELRAFNYLINAEQSRSVGSAA